jgi:nucleosome assembly protein 1-like 1
MEKSEEKKVYEEIGKIQSESLKKKLLYVQRLSEDRAKYQEDTYDQEYLTLKNQYDVEYLKIQDEIAKIVNGEVMPEISAEDSSKYKITTGESKEAGIPQYWAAVLIHSKDFYDVNEIDEKILKSLKDVKITPKEDKLSFSVDFHFTANEYFSNDVLSKTYHYNSNDHRLTKVEATKIEWKSADKIPNKIKKIKNIKSKNLDYLL